MSSNQSRMQPRNDVELMSRDHIIDEKHVQIFRHSIESASKGWSPHVLNDASPIVNNFKFVGKTANPSVSESVETKKTEVHVERQSL